MKTFAISINITGKITVPDKVLVNLRIAAMDDPATEGGDVFLNKLSKEHVVDDDFLQAALKNALRNIARNGITQDIAAMGVGIKAAPAVVTVSVPEHIVTAVKAREQISVDRIEVEPAPGSNGGRALCVGGCGHDISDGTLCDDEGCPQSGTAHVCINKAEGDYNPNTTARAMPDSNWQDKAEAILTDPKNVEALERVGIAVVRT